MVCLRFLPVVDVNLCRWWVWVCADLWLCGGGCGFVPVVGLGLCRSLWLFFFFFLRRRWWPSVFVLVVTVGDDDDDDDDSDRDRDREEEIIYYFNV